MPRFAKQLVVLILTGVLTVANASGAELTISQAKKLHKLIRPTAKEAAFLKIPWITSITAARQKAAREGKPIMLFMIHGHLLSGL